MSKIVTIKSVISGNLLAISLRRLNGVTVLPAMMGNSWTQSAKKCKLKTANNSLLLKSFCFIPSFTDNVAL
jgi:hypothetical protein